MNIKRAKNEIKNALRAYLARDAFGAYRIPPIRQRPILLMGPPGIGKTQIMEQIAEETGVGLVSYTLTHHTRQSALGLPFIETCLLYTSSTRARFSAPSGSGATDSHASCSTNWYGPVNARS